MDLSRGTSSGTESGPQPPGDGEDGESEGVTVTVDSSADGSGAVVGSRPSGFKGPRSEVLRISPEGAVESLLRFEEETVYALLWQRDRLWVGTGLEGKLYSVKERRPVLEEDVRNAVWPLPMLSLALAEMFQHAWGRCPPAPAWSSTSAPG